MQVILELAIPYDRWENEWRPGPSAVKSEIWERLGVTLASVSDMRTLAKVISRLEDIDANLVVQLLRGVDRILYLSKLETERNIRSMQHIFHVVLSPGLSPAPTPITVQPGPNNTALSLPTQRRMRIPAPKAKL
jgi:hypothetical protein